MKKMFKHLMAVALVATTISFAACGDDPLEEGIIENDGTYYAISHNDQKVTPLDTVVYTLTRTEVDDDFTTINFIFENLTSKDLSTLQKVEVLQGNAAIAADKNICGGGSCPWDKNPFTLKPGNNPDMPLTIDLHPSELGSTGTALLRIIVGEADNFAHATIIYLRIR